MLAEVYNKNKYLLSIRIFQLMLFLSGIQHGYLERTACNSVMMRVNDILKKPIFY